MKAYLDIVSHVLRNGVRTSNRTGVDTLSVSGVMFEHDMSRGFPLLTTKYVPFRLISSELEFFIHGITDKKWLQDRNNHIWDEWHSPETGPVPDVSAERELGPVYGWQWRCFGEEYVGHDQASKGYGVDQLWQLVEKLHTNPQDRRMLVTAWNPLDLHKMALPPCHYAFQVTVSGDRLNLLWNQRSVDVALGLPFNIAGYGLLLHLLAKEAGLKEGRLVGFLADTHVYVNHIEGLQKQLLRKTKQLPELQTCWEGSIFRWMYLDSDVIGYNHHDKIPFEVAV